MPSETNDDVNIDKLLEEIKGETSEVSDTPKKEDKNPYKDKKNDDSNTYEYSDDKDLSDDDW